MLMCVHSCSQCNGSSEKVNVILVSLNIQAPYQLRNTQTSKCELCLFNEHKKQIF